MVYMQHPVTSVSFGSCRRMLTVLAGPPAPAPTPPPPSPRDTIVSFCRLHKPALTGRLITRREELPLMKFPFSSAAHFYFCSPNRSCSQICRALCLEQVAERVLQRVACRLRALMALVAHHAAGPHGPGMCTCWEAGLCVEKDHASLSREETHPCWPAASEGKQLAAAGPLPAAEQRTADLARSQAGPQPAAQPLRPASSSR